MACSMYCAVLRLMQSVILTVSCYGDLFVSLSDCFYKVLVESYMFA